MTGRKTRADGKRSDATRERILEAARTRFSQEGYDGVGVRDLAASAGADAALVIRYFGSKEGLFREVVEGAFAADGLLGGDLATLPDQAVDHLFGEFDGEAWREGYDPFRLLLRSVGSATAGPIVAEAFAREFVEPLARALSGEGANARAAMVASYVLGVALVRVPLGTPAIQDGNQQTIRRLLAGAIRACLAENPL